MSLVWYEVQMYVCEDEIVYDTVEMVLIKWVMFEGPKCFLNKRAW
jgi:hypothetical protein